MSSSRANVASRGPTVAPFTSRGAVPTDRGPERSHVRDPPAWREEDTHSTTDRPLVGNLQEAGSNVRDGLCRELLCSSPAGQRSLAGNLAPPLGPQPLG